MEVKLVSFLFDKLGTQPYSYFFHKKRNRLGNLLLKPKEPCKFRGVVGFFYKYYCSGQVIFTDT